MTCLDGRADFICSSPSPSIKSYSLAKQSAATTATPAVAAGEPVLAKAIPTTATTAAATGAQECKLGRASLLDGTLVLT